MKEQNIKAYFAGDKSKARIELAIVDAQENQSYWERTKNEAAEKENQTLLGVALTALESAQSLVRSLQKRLNQEVTHG